jgi:hypothetical protein
MPKPQFYYKSAAVPVGTRQVSVYRPANPLTPAGPGGAGDTLIGTVLLEADSPQAPSTLGELKGQYGESTKMWLVQQRKTMSATVQLQTSAQPTVQDGDYFEDSFDVTTGGVATANERYVFHEVTNAESQDSARKQTCTLCIDWDNSARWA